LILCHVQEVLSSAGHLDELMRASSSGGSFQALNPQQQQQQQRLLQLPNSIPSADGRADPGSAAAAAAGMLSLDEMHETLTERYSSTGAFASKGDISPSEVTVQHAELRGSSASGSGGNAQAAAAAAAAAALLSGGNSSGALQPQQQAAVDWYINRFYNSFKDKPLGTIGSCRSTEDLEDWACGRLQGRRSRADRHSTEDRDKQASFEQWREANAAAAAAGSSAGGGLARGQTTVSDGGLVHGLAVGVAVDSGAGTVSDVEERLLHDRTTRDTLFEDIGQISAEQLQQQGQGRSTQETLLEEDTTHLVQQQQQQQQQRRQQEEEASLRGGQQQHEVHHVAFVQHSSSGSGSVAVGGVAGRHVGSAGGASDAAATTLLEQLKIAEVGIHSV
jgi:hypothetical protein